MGMLGVGPLSVFMIGCVLFSGAVVNWFAPGLVGGGWLGHALQLSAGAAVMGGLVALLGNVFLCRHAIRWGVLMPLLVLFMGSLVAMFSGRAGALELFLGVPLLGGVSVAGGLVTSFLVNGVLKVVVAE
jgi:hypothetical protein